jgi:transposase
MGLKMNKLNCNVFIGVDVSKDKLDFAYYGSPKAVTIENTEKDIVAKLIEVIQQKDDTLVVMEASGSYESLLASLLHQHHVPVAVVDGGRVRKFIKGVGQDAKTDAIDAKMIAYYASVVKPKPQLAKSEEDEKMTALVDRRQQLLKLISQEKNRLQQTRDLEIKALILKSLKSLRKQLETIDKRLEKCVSQSTKNARKIEIIQSISGFGPVITSMLICRLQELGTLNRQQIAKLVGVAPINNDSGKKFGSRTTFGGRCKVRRAIYMAALVGTRYNPRIKEFYYRLKEKGKPSKVALIACARKLLIILNTMIKNDELWDENRFQSSTTN